MLKTRMGYDQVRLLHDATSISEQIQVNGPRSPSVAYITPKRPFDLAQEGEEVSRHKQGVQHNHAIEKPAVARIRPIGDGLSFIK
jgi:hypothetical protein